MARDSINQLVQETSTWGNQQFSSQSSQLAELNNLRHRLADDYYNYVQERQERQNKNELSYLKKVEAARIDMLEDYYKKVAKAETAAEKEDLKKYKKKLDSNLEAYKKFLADREKLEQQSWQREINEAASRSAAALRSNPFQQGSWRRFREESAGLTRGATITAAVSGIIGGLADLSKKLDNQIDTIASYQALLDTRLQGTGKRWEGGFLGRGSLSQSITGIVGMSPYIKQETVVKNLATLVDKGIAYNVEQRAFLQTISDKIATTFDAANGTLLSLVRVQQADTTAARLGLEANLTRFLNGMFQSTEYLSDVSPSIKEALYEATANMSAESGVAFEYQVQKWLGSLYSVGMSRSGVQSIASALGMLGSGNISGLAGSPAMQNLLVMSASRAGKSYAELLTQGLNDSDVNTLMKSMVEYLAEIAAGTNNVVKAQYGSIFGMSLSDLRSVGNVLKSIGSISRTSLNYGGALSELYSQAGQMGSRTSIGEMMQNVWSNLQYSMASGVATNPALYAIWKAASLLEDTVGGIDFSIPLYMGTGTAQTFNVADIMRVGALSGGILSSIGAMIGAGGGGGLSGAKMLEAFGIKRGGLSVVSRGAGLGMLSSGEQISQSAAIVGNASGEDIYSSTVAGTQSEQSSKVAQAKEENADAVSTKQIDDHIVDIYALLKGIIVEDMGIRIYSEVRP